MIIIGLEPSVISRYDNKESDVANSNFIAITPFDYKKQIMFL